MLETLLDGGYLPTPVIRAGIRAQLRQRISTIAATSLATAYSTKMNYVDLLRTRPIAIETATANTQHYEVGTGVLSACLGPRMKYSCCLYEDDAGKDLVGRGKDALGKAEVRMMEDYVAKAGLVDGMRVFDLGFVLLSSSPCTCHHTTPNAPCPFCRTLLMLDQLRMGFPISLPSRNLPQFIHNSLFKLSHPKGIHRLSRRIKRLQEPQRNHRRHLHLDGTGISTVKLRPRREYRAFRTHEELSTAPAKSLDATQAWWQAFCAYFCAQG